MGKGKLSGSPFHVEYFPPQNDELGTYIVPESKCKYRGSGHTCSFANSINYEKQCKIHSCKLFQSNLRRKSKPAECAFYVECNCYRSFKKENTKINCNNDVVTYCDYFLERQGREAKFDLIRHSIEEQLYEQKISKAELHIQRVEKRIKQLQKEKTKYSPNSEAYATIISDINCQNNKILLAMKKLDNIKKEIQVWKSM